MPAPAPFIAHGSTGYWGPGLRKQRRLGSLDTLRGTYIDDPGDVFMPGDAVPDHPGMIILDVEEQDGGCGSSDYRINAMGSLDNLEPRKVISIQKQDSLEPVFDTITVDLYATRSEMRSFTISAPYPNKLVISAPQPFEVGDKVRIFGTALPAGLGSNMVYHIVSRTAFAFYEVSETPGGSPLAFTSTFTSGKIVLDEFARGSRLEYAKYELSDGELYLRDISSSEDDAFYLPWRRLRLSYAGILGTKGYKRTITVNGKTFSRDSLAINLPGGGWTTSVKGSGQQPTIEVADIMVVAADPNLTEYVPTSDVLNAHNETRVIPGGVVIPNPPAVNMIYNLVSGDVTRQWPCFWSFVGCDKVDEIPGTPVCLIRKVWRYEWKFTF